MCRVAIYSPLCNSIPELYEKYLQTVRDGRCGGVSCNGGVDCGSVGTVGRESTEGVELFGVGSGGYVGDKCGWKTLEDYGFGEKRKSVGACGRAASTVGAAQALDEAYVGKGARCNGGDDTVVGVGDDVGVCWDVGTGSCREGDKSSEICGYDASCGVLGDGGSVVGGCADGVEKLCVKEKKKAKAKLRRRERRARERSTRSGGGGGVETSSVATFDYRRWKLEHEWFCTECVDGGIRCEVCALRRESMVAVSRHRLVPADAGLKVSANGGGDSQLPYVIPARRIGVPADRCTSCVESIERCDGCRIRFEYRVEKCAADLEQLRAAKKSGTYLWRENRPVTQSRVSKFVSQRVQTVCSGPKTRPNSAMSGGSDGSGSVSPGSSASRSKGTPASSVTQRSVEDELLIAGLKEQLSELRKNEEAMTKRLNESDASSEVIRQLRRENRAKSDRIDNLTRRLQK